MFQCLLWLNLNWELPEHICGAWSACILELSRPLPSSKMLSNFSVNSPYGIRVIAVQHPWESWSKCEGVEEKGLLKERSSCFKIFFLLREHPFPFLNCILFNTVSKKTKVSPKMSRPNGFIGYVCDLEVNRSEKVGGARENSIQRSKLPVSNAGLESLQSNNRSSPLTWSFSTDRHFLISDFVQNFKGRN